MSPGIPVEIAFTLTLGLGWHQSLRNKTLEAVCAWTQSWKSRPELPQGKIGARRTLLGSTSTSTTLMFALVRLKFLAVNRDVRLDVRTLFTL